MSVTNFTSKFNFSGDGYLDAKMGPYANLEELIASIDVLELVEGLSATVLDDGNGKPCDYWYIGKKWVRKEDSQMRADIDSNTLWNEEQDKQIESLKDKVESIKSDIQTLKDTDTTQNSRMDRMQAQIDSIEEGTGNVNVDGTSITNDGGTLSVKVSTNEGNFLKKEDNGIFAGIPVDGDDCGIEIQ